MRHKKRTNKGRAPALPLLQTWRPGEQRHVIRAPCPFPHAVLSARSSLSSICQPPACPDAAQRPAAPLRQSWLFSLWSRPRAVVTNYHKRGGFNNRSTVPHCSGDPKSKVKVAAGPGSLQGRWDRTLPRFPLFPGLAETSLPSLPLCSRGLLLCVCVSVCHL